ncbi:MAG: PDZ domain-containing protein [Candidatus Obscuribacterales bacterium]|jgi:C-terminal processing protease CtpA/Prc|nr:PDZ domain-containing protein [Candidatus Obscuribacterales bacterium]
MNQKSQNSTGTILATLVAASLVLFSGQHVSAAAQDVYKSAEPKLDAPPERKEAPKAKAPLVGNIQHTEKNLLQRGKLMFGGKKDLPPVAPSYRAHVNENSQALKSQLESSIGIIGVKFVAVAGRAPVINEIFPGTPAEQVGLRLYDTIVAVDGIPTAGLTKDEVFDMIVGTPGTSVTLTIMRNGDYQAMKCMRMDINQLIDARVRRDYLMHM